MYWIFSTQMSSKIGLKKSGSVRKEHAPSQIFRSRFGDVHSPPSFHCNLHFKNFVTCNYITNEMMRALLQLGRSEGNDVSAYGNVSVFKLGEIEKPSTPPSPSEVIIKVHASSFNPVDVRRANFSSDKKFPVVVGYDLAGTVEAIGSEVEDLSVGDQVYGDIMANSGGPKHSGSIAEFAVSPANILDKIPENISFVEASGLPVVAQTAIQALRQAGTKEGDSVFVTAGAGGVGIHLLQLAKPLFKVGKLATTCSTSKVEFVKKYGAEVVVDYKTQDAGEVLKEWADVVIDCTSEFEMERKVCKPGGKIVSIVEPCKPDIELCVLVPSKIEIRTVSELVKAGKLKPVVDSIHSLDNAIDALNRQASGRASGKVVVKIID